jgi:hypothetical protein
LFFAGFKQDSPGFLGDPQGCPRHGETRENYRTEYIKFEVANFETSYHAILGRPAIAKFMAVPHYTYLVLKMPSPAGVLSRYKGT